MNDRFTVFFTNHGYAAAETATTFGRALEIAKRAGFEASILDHGAVCAAWSPLYGLRRF